MDITSIIAKDVIDNEFYFPSKDGILSFSHSTSNFIHNLSTAEHKILPTLIKLFPSFESLILSIDLCLKLFDELLYVIDEFLRGILLQPSMLKVGSTEVLSPNP